MQNKCQSYKDSDNSKYRKQLHPFSLEFKEGDLREFYRVLFEQWPKAVFHTTMLFKTMMLSTLTVGEILYFDSIFAKSTFIACLLLFITLWQVGRKSNHQIQNIFRLCHILLTTIMFFIVLQISEASELTESDSSPEIEDSNHHIAALASIVFSLFQIVYIQLERKWLFKVLLIFYVILQNTLILGRNAYSLAFSSISFVFIAILLYQQEIAKMEGSFQIYRVIEDFQSLKTLIDDILPMQIMIVQRNQKQNLSAPLTQLRSNSYGEREQVPVVSLSAPVLQISPPINVNQADLYQMEAKTLVQKENKDDLVANKINKHHPLESPSIFEKRIRQKLTNNTGSCLSETHFKEAGNPQIQTNLEDAQPKSHRENSTYEEFTDRLATNPPLLSQRQDSNCNQNIPDLNQKNIQQQNNPSLSHDHPLKIAFANKLIHQDFSSTHFDDILREMSNIYLPSNSKEQHYHKEDFNASTRLGGHFQKQNMNESLADALHRKFYKDLPEGTILEQLGVPMIPKFLKPAINPILNTQTAMTTNPIIAVNPVLCNIAEEVETHNIKTIPSLQSHRYIPRCKSPASKAAYISHQGFEEAISNCVGNSDIYGKVVSGPQNPDLDLNSRDGCTDRKTSDHTTRLLFTQQIVQKAYSSAQIQSPNQEHGPTSLLLTKSPSVFQKNSHLNNKASHFYSPHIQHSNFNAQSNQMIGIIDQNNQQNSQVPLHTSINNYLPANKQIIQTNQANNQIGINNSGNNQTPRINSSKNQAGVNGVSLAKNSQNMIVSLGNRNSNSNPINKLSGNLQEKPQVNIYNYVPQKRINYMQEYMNCLYRRSNTEEEKNYDIRLVECRWDGEESVMVIMNNVNERLMRERLIEIEQYKDTVIDTISHNLKTPLNCILAPLESIKVQMEQQQQQKNQTEQDESVRQVSMAINNCQLLLLMINDMIDYSRIIKGDSSFRLNVDHFKLSYIIKVLNNLFEDQMQSKKLEFRIITKTDPSESIIFHDQRRLLQVLVSLISNSLKYTLKGKVELIIDNQSDDLSYHNHLYNNGNNGGSSNPLQVERSKRNSFASMRHIFSPVENANIKGSVSLRPHMVKGISHERSFSHQLDIAHNLSNSLKKKELFKNSINPEQANDMKKQQLQEQHIRFVLIDTGIGMSQQKLHKLKRMLFKKDYSASRNSSGLGLIMCHTLIKQIGCSHTHFDIQSEENIGTRFAFTIQQFYQSDHNMPNPPPSFQNIPSHQQFPYKRSTSDNLNLSPKEIFMRTPAEGNPSKIPDNKELFIPTNERDVNESVSVVDLPKNHHHPSSQNIDHLFSVSSPSTGMFGFQEASDHADSINRYNFSNLRTKEVLENAQLQTQPLMVQQINIPINIIINDEGEELNDSSNEGRNNYYNKKSSFESRSSKINNNPITFRNKHQSSVSSYQKNQQYQISCGNNEGVMQQTSCGQIVSGASKKRAFQNSVSNVPFMGSPSLNQISLVSLNVGGGTGVGSTVLGECKRKNMNELNTYYSSITRRHTILFGKNAKLNVVENEDNLPKGDDEDDDGDDEDYDCEDEKGTNQDIRFCNVVKDEEYKEDQQDAYEIQEASVNLSGTLKNPKSPPQIKSEIRIHSCSLRSSPKKIDMDFLETDIKKQTKRKMYTFGGDFKANERIYLNTTEDGNDIRNETNDQMNRNQGIYFDQRIPSQHSLNVSHVDQCSENKSQINTQKYLIAATASRTLISSKKFIPKSHHLSSRSLTRPRNQSQQLNDFYQEEPTPSPSVQTQFARESRMRMIPQLQTETNIEESLEIILANKRIFIVDDTVYNIMAFKMLIRNVKNLMIEEAFNGKDALEKFQDFANNNIFFDYIFIDIEMPVMDGLECIAHIRDFETSRNLARTIIITVTAYERDLEEVLLAGANSLVSKPIQKDKFIKTLRLISQNPQQINQMDKNIL